MPARTLQGMIASVSRNMGAAKPSLGQIQQALDSANKEFHARYEWPWTYAETNLLIQPTYSTGTIAITDGTAAVVGTGTVWNTLWTNKRISFGSNNSDYIVSAITSPTTLTLAQIVNLGTSPTAASYTMFQDVYDMPADWEPGTDLVLVNPTIRYVITHIPRRPFQIQNVVLKQLYSNIQNGYADYEFNSLTNCYRIQLVPPPSSYGEYRMVYRRRPPDLATPLQRTYIPQGFDEVIELMAEADLRRVGGLRGVADVAARATSLIQLLRRRIAASNVENTPDAHTGMTDSSISWRGLSIRPGWTP